MFRRVGSFELGKVLRLGESVDREEIGSKIKFWEIYIEGLGK